MAANPAKNENVTYYDIITGNIIKRVEANTEGAVERINAKGNKVHELIYGSLTGIIKDIEIIVNDEFGDKLIITMSDMGEIEKLRIGVESKYFSSFVQRIKNIPANTVVTIKPFDFKKGEDHIVGLNVFIGRDEKGEKILPFLTKENPGKGCPVFPEGGDKSDIKVWGIQRNKFLKQHLDENKGKFTSGNKLVEKVTTKQEEADDLPF